MAEYKIVMEMNEATVVASYVPEKKESDAFQSEAALENEFIRLLQSQGYEYLEIHHSDELKSNLRTQLENLNKYKFSDSEWDEFFSKSLCNSNEGIKEKARKIQEESIINMKKDDGSTKNITLIDKKNIHNNHLQVINQYVENSGKYDNRYDVTVLVNGFPLVHIELKKRGIPIKEAFNQINRYGRESFWAGDGLYEYVQIFVISNGTHTKYYSNTTRYSHIAEQTQKRNTSRKTSNSFEFTSFWADANNKTIPDLVDFTKTFFAKHTILNILTRYCVFTSEELLLVMRPYQIVATERILNRIEVSTNYKQQGTLAAGGYIWHTTGSGKTLTSFKTALLASKMESIDKVLFVVDRKDLDYQTMKEYDRFEKGAANGNRSTRVLQNQLENKDQKGNPHTYKIIVTTIQKLSEFIKRNPHHPALTEHMVLIFDECHRSQFGDMHRLIVKNFKNYHLFGFTGTPIFAVNAGNKKRPDFCTTEQAFGDKLHTYTIVDAIHDQNVLPFRIDFINTVRQKEGIQDKKVQAIETDEVLNSPERISNVVRYILEHFDQKTKRNSHYDLKGKRVNGFNSMFAVSSIPVAKMYYLEFKKQLEEQHKDLSIATIYSYAPNEDIDDETGFVEDEDFDTSLLDKSSREFLDSVIDDYNKRFHTNFSTKNDGFQNYYKDLSDRIKKREIDLVIVVNMFLTGFDATTLNTLWVDKNLKYHGLIQAFSRTNRILNSVKTFGNIVCFRDLQTRTNEAISLFGDKEALGTVVLRSFLDYLKGYTDDKGKHIKGYEEQVDELLTRFPLDEDIIGEKNEKDFIMLMGKILRLRNILSCFDQFADNNLLSDSQIQDYTGIYVDLYGKYSKPDVDAESVKKDLIFEMELVKQVEVNIDYILELVKKYHDNNCKDKEIIEDIEKAIHSSISLRSKKELIEAFLARINTVADVSKDWVTFVKEQREAELAKLISDENLNEEEARQFVIRCFKEGTIKTNGTDIEKILPPMRRFGGAGTSRTEKKQIVIDKLKVYFEKFYGLVQWDDDAEEDNIITYSMNEDEDYQMAAENSSDSKD